MTKLYILCGLPFAGKSLLSEAIRKKKGVDVVSFDMVWESLTSANKALTYDLVLDKIEKKLKDNLTKGIDTVYDSTNVRKEHREKLIELAKESKAEAIVIYLPEPIEVINERRAKSLIDKTHHEVDDVNFNRAITSLEPPTDAIILHDDQEKEEFLNSL